MQYSIEPTPAGVEGVAVLADRSDDSSTILAPIAIAGLTDAILCNRTCKSIITHDHILCRQRKRIGRYIEKRKLLHRVATRLDRPTACVFVFGAPFAGVIPLTAPKTQTGSPAKRLSSSSAVKSTAAQSLLPKEREPR